MTLASICNSAYIRCEACHNGVGQIRSSTRAIRDSILAVLQTQPGIGMTPKELALKIETIANNFGEDEEGRPPTVSLNFRSINRSTVRSHLHRMQNEGEVTSKNGRWQAVASFSVQKESE